MVIVPSASKVKTANPNTSCIFRIDRSFFIAPEISNGNGTLDMGSKAERGQP